MAAAPEELAGSEVGGEDTELETAPKEAVVNLLLFHTCIHVFLPLEFDFYYAGLI